MDGISLRPLGMEDIPAISEIHAQACRIAYAFMGWDHALEDVRRWYESEKFAQWDWGLVAEAGGAEAGFIAMTGAHIDQLFIRPARQGQGIGSGLMDAALARNLRPATLDVFEGNAPARRFYERYGFSEHDRWFNQWDKAVELRYVLATG